MFEKSLLLLLMHFPTNITFQIFTKFTMPHIISQTQDEERCMSPKVMDAKCSIGVSTTHALHETNEKSAKTHQSSLVTVWSHLCKKRGRGRKTNKPTCKRMHPMDIASFKEITRMERADNEMLRASKSSSITKIAGKKKTSQLWNGFWKNAIRMESQKHRNVLAVVQSKEAMAKKKLNSEETQEEDVDNVPISKSLNHPLEETQEEDADDVPISQLLHHPSMIE